MGSQKNKQAAIELSMGTIVILVLAMLMLVLGIVLLKNIFTTANEAIGNIDQGVRKSIMDAFSDPNKKIVVYPAAREIEIQQRTDGKGFAFSLRNVGIDDETFVYNIGIDPNFDIKSKCKISAKEAESWLLSSSGSISLGKGALMEDPELIKFNIPDNAPPCSTIWKIDVKKQGGDLYVSTKVILTIKPR